MCTIKNKDYIVKMAVYHLTFMKRVNYMSTYIIAYNVYVTC